MSPLSLGLFSVLKVRQLMRRACSGSSIPLVLNTQQMLSHLVVLLNKKTMPDTRLHHFISEYLSESVLIKVVQQVMLNVEQMNLGYK